MSMLIDGISSPKRKQNLTDGKDNIFKQKRRPDWGAILPIILSISFSTSNFSFANSPSSESTSTFQTSGVETFSAEWIGDNGKANESLYGDDDNFSRYINRLYFDTKHEGFDGALRLDTTFFLLPPKRVDVDNFAPGGSGYTILDYDNDYRLEHLHGTVRAGKLTAVLGDFYASFGRGMVLSLVKTDEFGEDNRLRGAKLDYRIPRKLQVTLLGGVVNAANVDFLTKQILRDDPLDRIGGARIQWEMLDALGLSAHAIIVKPRFTDSEQIAPDRLYVDRGPGVDIVSGGGSAEIHIEGIHVYVEGNGQAHTNHRAMGRDAQSESGAAVYGEISYDLSGFSIKAEGIHRRRWLMEGPYRGSGSIVTAKPLSYHNMPTLEENFVPLKSSENASGMRLSTDYHAARINLDLKLKCTVIKYLGGLLPNGKWNDSPPILTVHPTAEADVKLRNSSSTIRLAGGGRSEHTNKPELAGVDFGGLWHVETYLMFAIQNFGSINTFAQLRRHELNITEGHDYYAASVGLGYALAGRFDVSAAYEYSNDSNTGQNRIGTIPWLAAYHFLCFRSTVHLSSIRKGMSLKLFAGSERGGIKCAGGMCRQVPNSVGVRLDMSLSF